MKKPTNKEIVAVAVMYQVVQYTGDKFDAVVAGMGRNRGTWDAEHPRRSAQRHARRLRLDPKRAGLTYRVERTT